jgi:hypothetical protein
VYSSFLPQAPTAWSVPQFTLLRHKSSKQIQIHRRSTRPRLNSTISRLSLQSTKTIKVSTIIEDLVLVRRRTQLPFYSFFSFLSAVAELERSAASQIQQPGKKKGTWRSQIVETVHISRIIISRTILHPHLHQCRMVNSRLRPANNNP